MRLWRDRKRRRIVALIGLYVHSDDRAERLGFVEGNSDYGELTEAWLEVLREKA